MAGISLNNAIAELELRARETPHTMEALSCQDAANKCREVRDRLNRIEDWLRGEEGIDLGRDGGRVAGASINNLPAAEEKSAAGVQGRSRLED